MRQMDFVIEDGCSAILFDCDGTLVDTTRAHLAGYNLALAEHGAVMSWQWYRERLGINARDLLLLFAREFAVPLEIERAMPIYARAFHDNLNLVREISIVAEVARKYHRRLPMAVASNGHGEHVRASLTQAGLLPLFDVTLGRESVTHGKPAPDLYLEAARRLGVDAHRCLVFEDSKEGLESARRAGMQAYDVSFAMEEQRDGEG
jgi:beta-phosphoglucomutase-like phosphatase (HAD superfamily)